MLRTRPKIIINMSLIIIKLDEGGDNHPLLRTGLQHRARVECMELFSMIFTLLMFMYAITNNKKDIR